MSVPVTRQAAALLLHYPDPAWWQRLPAVRAAVAELPASAPRRELVEFLDGVGRARPGELEKDYVDTFDLKRRRTLHLTFYADGDTRRRGHSLARIKEIYRASGWVCDARELPDHLAVVLEFAARADPDAGQRLLLAFQPGLELLRSALHEHGTGYARLLDAVAATLPPPGEAQRAETIRLARNGPPAEDVGVEPFGTVAALGMPRVGFPAGNGEPVGGSVTSDGFGRGGPPAAPAGYDGPGGLLGSPAATTADRDFTGPVGFTGSSASARADRDFTGPVGFTGNPAATTADRDFTGPVGFTGNPAATTADRDFTGPASATADRGRTGPATASEGDPTDPASAPTDGRTAASRASGAAP